MTCASGSMLSVKSLDKFPPMLDYVQPSGVRIADASRVRLGAHLAEGTTVMHEGFVNFNAGTLGTSMVEGRISAGVVTGDGTAKPRGIVTDATVGVTGPTGTATSFGVQTTAGMGTVVLNDLYSSLLESDGSR